MLAHYTDAAAVAATGVVKCGGPTTTLSELSKYSTHEMKHVATFLRQLLVLLKFTAYSSSCAPYFYTRFEVRIPT